MRRPDGHTVKAVLEESAIPRKLVRRFPPYHEAGDVMESREAVVTLHLEGWSDKSIARYLRVDRSTVYRVRRRFEEEGEQGLEDRPGGRPRGVQKVDLRAMTPMPTSRCSTPPSSATAPQRPSSPTGAGSSAPTAPRPSTGH